MGKSTNIVVLVLAILLVLAVGYIAYDKFMIWRQEKDLSTFQVGAQYGYEQAVSQLFQQVKTCQQVPIIYNNETLNIVAVECVSQQS